MKSVLHLAIHSAGYDSTAIGKAWTELGYGHTQLNWQECRFNHGIEETRKIILREAAKLRPTIIFAHIQNQELFDEATWKELSDLSFVINFTFDVRQPEEMQWMYDAAKIVGYTFFACQEDVLISGVPNAALMQSSCDMEVFKPNEKNLTALDICFVGNKFAGTNLNFPFAEEREAMVEFLQKNYPINLGIYGLGRSNGPIVAGVEANVYNFSKVAISHNNFFREGYCSDRMWRIMATGCFCLTKYFPGLEKIFKKEEHLDWWEDFDELKALLDYYLSHDEERKSIAAAGCAKVRAEHRWQDRIARMLAKIQETGIGLNILSPAEISPTIAEVP